MGGAEAPSVRLSHLAHASFSPSVPSPVLSAMIPLQAVVGQPRPQVQNALLSCGAAATGECTPAPVSDRPDSPPQSGPPALAPPAGPGAHSSAAGPAPSP